MSKTTDIPVIPVSVAMQIVRELAEMANRGEPWVPPMIWGPPGVGKSSLVKEVAEELGIGFIDLRLVQIDQVDLRGLPYVFDDPENPGHKKFGFAPPSMLPTKGRGILFLDEFPQAQPPVQNAASELVLDRRIGDYQLPQGWIIIAAGNRRSDRAATQEMPSHLKNRFAHIEIEARFEDWKAWAETAGAVEPRLINYLSQNQTRLNQFNPDATASPTSRTWEFASHVIKGVKDIRARNALIGGCVGKGSQAEVSAFLADGDDMPTIDQICKDPENAPVPELVSSQNSVLDNMATTIKPQFAKQAAIYARRFDRDAQMVAAIQMVARKDAAKFEADPTFKAWSDEIMGGA